MENKMEEFGQINVPVAKMDTAIQSAPDDTENRDHLDEHGRIIHKDSINFKLKHADVIFMWKSVKLVVEKGLVPEPEVGPVLTLMELLAEREEVVHREGNLFLPVNYFVGLWHVLNTCRKFDLYNSKQFYKKGIYLDKLTTRVAESVDAYHSVKSHEKNQERIEAPEYFKEVSKNASRISYDTSKDKQFGVDEIPTK